MAWKVSRLLICTENRGTRKIPQVMKQNIVCHFKNWQHFCTYTTSVNFSWLLVTTESQLFQQKKKKQYKYNRWFYVMVTTESQLFQQKKKQYKYNRWFYVMVPTESQLFQQKKKTIHIQQVVLCHLYLVGLQIRQCFFF